MATPHVFIVSEQTFPLHLQYMFAGTQPRKGLDHYAPLLADISRVRAGDPVVFYLLKHGFFGTYRIAKDCDHPFWEKSDGWLQKELGMPLVYRVPIEPEEVFARGVSEWDAIDNLPAKSRDIRWSLFYRKLKGERGCSYLFPREFESLRELIRGANGGKPIALKSGTRLTWANGLVSAKQGLPDIYLGSKKGPVGHELEPAKSESHLQAWFTQNIGRLPLLDPICGSPNDLQWFANEVYCGSGMQRMDILTISGPKGMRTFRVVELKVAPATPEEMANQLYLYVRWLSAYVLEPGDRVTPVWVTTVDPGAGVKTESEQIDARLRSEFGAAPVEIWHLDFGAKGVGATRRA